MRAHAEEEGRHRRVQDFLRGRYRCRQGRVELEGRVGPRCGIPDGPGFPGHLGGTEDEVREEERLLGVAQVLPDIPENTRIQGAGPAADDVGSAEFRVAVLGPEGHLDAIHVDVAPPTIRALIVREVSPGRDTIVGKPGAQPGDAVHPVLVILDDIVPVAIVVAVHRPAGSHGLEVQQQGLVDQVLPGRRARAFVDIVRDLPGARVIGRIRRFRRAEPTAIGAQVLPVDALVVQQVEIPFLVTTDGGRPIAQAGKNEGRGVRHTFLADHAVIVIHPTGVAHGELQGLPPDVWWRRDIEGEFQAARRAVPTG